MTVIPSLSGALYVIVGAALWGVAAAISKVAVSVVGPWPAVLIGSVVIATVVLVGVLAIGVTSVLGDAMQVGVVYPTLKGPLSGFAFIVFSEGLEATDASVAKPLLVAGTIVTVVLGVLRAGERFTLLKPAGIAAGICAVYSLSAG